MSNNVTNLVKDIEKTFGKGSFFRIGDNEKIPINTLSSGSVILDKCLGGGYPEGRIIEIFGQESTGKTTLALLAVAQAQKRGDLAAFIDAEHALDLTYAEQIGVNTDDLYISQPDCGEMALEILDKIVASQKFKIVVVDSVAALTPRKEIEGEMGDSVIGLQARLMSQACRKLAAKINRSNCIVIFINQIRVKIGVLYGNPETTTGGTALKFYTSQRLEVRKGLQEKNDKGEAIGHILKIKVVKNKVFPPFKVAETTLLYGIGISQVEELVKLAVDENIIEKKGSWYYYDGVTIGQGLTNVLETLNDNVEVYEKIKKTLKI